ncbi:MAG: alpha/beta hydrolase [Pseudomonadota bacterium]
MKLSNKSFWLKSIAIALGLTFTFAASAQELPSPRATQTVEGGGGVQLAVQKWGNPDGRPIVFVHAFVSSHLGYLPIVAGGPVADNFNLITFDNRGHGNSEKPTDLAAYQSGQLLADDLAAVIKLAGDQKPIIVAWSIGGVILDDYLAAYGDENIAGAVYLGAGHTLGEHAKAYIAEGFAQYAPGIMSPDLATNVAATIGVTVENTAQPLPPEMFTAAVATAMVVPLEARAGLISRPVNHIKDTLPNVTVPLRFLHGTADRIVRPSSSADAAAAAPNAKLVEIEGIGHVPAFEAPGEVIAAIMEIAEVTK